MLFFNSATLMHVTAVASLSLAVFQLYAYLTLGATPLSLAVFQLVGFVWFFVFACDGVPPLLPLNAVGVFKRAINLPGKKHKNPTLQRKTSRSFYVILASRLLFRTRFAVILRLLLILLLRVFLIFLVLFACYLCLLCMLFCRSFLVLFL